MWLQAHGCQRIYGLGESLGGSVLIQASAVKPIFNAIAAECPYADLTRIAEYRVRKMSRLPMALSYPLAKFVTRAGLFYAKYADHADLTQVNPLQSMQHSITPIFLIHGLADNETPPANSQELSAIRPMTTELWLVPGAGHTSASSVAPAQFHDRVMAWFAGHP